MEVHRTLEDITNRGSLSSPGATREKSSNQHSSASTDAEGKYTKLLSKAKEYASQGNVRHALELNKRALAIRHSDKLARKIGKMEAYLEEYGDDSEEEGDDMVHVGKGFYLYKDLCEKLYPHQKEGILWMWTLYKKKKGGILGDDMGLGKTIQVVSFLSGMFDAEKIHSVLIILPVSIIINWEREFEKWAPGMRVEAFHGNSKRERELALKKVQRRGGVCLTSYGMLVNHFQTLAEDNCGREFIWDYVILDEGHKIKNPSNKCSKGVHAIPARNRLILTGTPIQNNLKEMWSLFDWTHQGSLLGTLKTFVMEFENPIIRARQRDATLGEQRLGQEIANGLKNIITPYFMRRTKAEVQRAKNKEIKDEGDGDGHKSAEMPSLTRKNDLIIWTFLSETQQRLYHDFLMTEDVRELLNTSKSPLTALVILKKICDHPRLLTYRQCIQLGLDGDPREVDEDEENESAGNRVNKIASEVLLSEGGKVSFLLQLLDSLKREGHRCLIFSQSRVMLDIIQKVITSRGHKPIRLDGTIRHLYEREQIIKKFTTDMTYNVFLLTTQVGGVGLTLTAADRVVIYDPSWNPATDAQAVDRAFRIGQDKDVVIYRLITCGSVEEKIYRRQIFKDSVTKQTTGDSKNPYRYFTKQELHELFVLDNPRHSRTQEQLEELHSGQRKSDTSLDAHIAFLHSLDIFGISDHDLMFSQESQIEELEEEQEQGNDYIQHRVQRAHELISVECSNNEQQTQQTGKYLAPEVHKDRPEAKRGAPTYNWKPPGAMGAEDFVDMTGTVNSQKEETCDNELDVSMQEMKITDVKQESSSTLISLPQEENVVVDLITPQHHYGMPRIKVETPCKEITSVEKKMEVDLTSPQHPSPRTFVKKEHPYPAGRDLRMSSDEKIDLTSPVKYSTNVDRHIDLTLEHNPLSNGTPAKRPPGGTPKEVPVDIGPRDQISDSVTASESHESNIVNNSPDSFLTCEDADEKSDPEKSYRSEPNDSESMDTSQEHCEKSDSNRWSQDIDNSNFDTVQVTPVRARQNSSIKLETPPKCIPQESDVVDMVLGTPLVTHANDGNTPRRSSYRPGRRKSVCAARTPRQGEAFLPPPPEDLQQEQIVISPKAAEPVVRTVPKFAIGSESPEGSPRLRIVSEEPANIVEESPENSSDEEESRDSNKRVYASVSDTDSDDDSDQLGRSHANESAVEDTPESVHSRSYSHTMDASPVHGPRKTVKAVIVSSDEEEDQEVPSQDNDVGMDFDTSDGNVPAKDHSFETHGSHKSNVSALDYQADEESDEEGHRTSLQGGNREVPVEEDMDQHGTHNTKDVVPDDTVEEVETGEESDEERESVEENEEESEEEDQEEEEESEEEEEEDLTEEDQERYIQYMTESKKCYKAGQYGEAMRYALDALDIYSGDERAQRYALKLQEKLGLGN